MNKILFALCLVVSGLLNSSFAEKETWFLFETKNCSVLFPQKVETTTQAVQSDVGELKMETTMFDASVTEGDDNLVYSLTSVAYPDSVINSDKKNILSGFFRGAIDGSVKNLNGVLLSEKEIEIKGFPGREIRVYYNNEQAVITMRCYLVHNIMYLLQTITLTEKEKNPAALKFMNSFSLRDL